MPPRHVATGKRLWLHGLFLLGILSLFLLGMEVVLRWTNLFGATVSWSEPDPQIGYRFSPGYRYWYHKETERPITGRINSYGWRDREWSIGKPPGVYRVAVLGDSFVEAFQVESDRTFLSLAERRFNAEPCGVQVELMNFGRAGYTQTEQLIVLRREVFPFSPDLVVLVFFPGNDIEDVSPETAPNAAYRPFFVLSDSGELVLDTSFNQGRRYRMRALVNPIKQGSALVSLVGERYNLYKGQRVYEARFGKAGAPPEGGQPPAPTPGDPLPRALSLSTDRPDPAYVRSYDMNKTLIREMATLCRERGVRLLITVMFGSDYLPEEAATLKAMDPSYNPRFFEEDMQAFAKRLGADFLPLFEPARRHMQQGGEPLTVDHLNQRGHELVGDLLEKKLLGLLCEETR